MLLVCSIRRDRVYMFCIGLAKTKLQKFNATKVQILEVYLFSHWECGYRQALQREAADLDISNFRNKSWKFFQLNQRHYKHWQSQKNLIFSSRDTWLTNHHHNNNNKLQIIQAPFKINSILAKTWWSPSATLATSTKCYSILLGQFLKSVLVLPDGW